ncbi:hypothetical protein [Phytohabitans rumicis]|uniref:Uncharacterized protein n=1 Tax=Phytohabitans rumicis TaxID=1076125 RepID=A0A6V8KU08_9ACTN|nr:hypothetical protein [Phytohabitans rumicis]GFJ88572.1 hypothetical protein Prum_022140 [Phytohabitans rumicis]
MRFLLALLLVLPVGACSRDEEKGFFAAANIEVEIRPGSLSTLMIVLGNGKSRADVGAVGAIQQTTLNSVTVPWLLFSAYAKLAGVVTGAPKPEDLVAPGIVTRGVQ